MLSMENQQWNRIPGTRAADLYPFLTKPSVRTCNSYLIRTPEYIAAIDPGGIAEQTSTIFKEIHSLLAEKERPVYLCFTHCHVDHTLGYLKKDFTHSIVALRVALHQAGADVLTSGDRRISQAEILECDYPPLEAQVIFHSREGRPQAQMPGSAYEVIPRDATADAMEVYALPGHSPDHVGYRIGDVFFVGDLLVATAPLIAGAPGWNCADLRGSLKTTLEIFQAHALQYLCPGHGLILDGEAARKAVTRTLREALELPVIPVIDAARVRVISEHARELFEELNLTFGIVLERIERLAERMHMLEEIAAADAIRRIIDSEQVSQLLVEFQNFQEGLQSGELIDVQVAIKGVQIAQRILRLLEFDKLLQIIDPALVRLTRSLLLDVTYAAKGLRRDDERQELDLNPWVTAFVAELQTHSGSAAELEDIPSDEEGFRSYLVRAFAHVPVFKAIEIDCSLSPEPLVVRMDEVSFHDNLKRLLEDVVEAGAAQMALSVTRDDQGAVLEIKLAIIRPVYSISEHRIKPYRRRLMSAGARLSVKYERAAVLFRINWL